MAFAGGWLHSSRKSILQTILVAVAIVIAFFIAVAFWLLHNPDRFLPDAIATIEQKTGLQVQVHHVSVTLFPLEIQLNGVEVKNPKPFPQGDFLNAPTIKARLKLGPLLHQHLAFRTVVLEHPTIDFISDPDGLWNFQNPAGLKKNPKQEGEKEDPKQQGQAATKPKKKQLRFSMGTISTLRIEHGELLGSALIDPADSPGPVILEVHDFSAKLRQFKLTALNRHSRSPAIGGKVQAPAARFGAIHLRNLHSRLRILPVQFTFKNFSAKTYRGRASGDLTLNFAEANTRFYTDLKVSGIGMPYLLREFHNKGPARLTGMMQADMTLSGTLEHTAHPFTGLQGGGQFSIAKGEFPTLAGNAKMAEMKKFRNDNAAHLPVSAFSKFTGDMEFKSDHIYSRRLEIDFYGIQVAGSGNVDEQTGKLDYRGSATIMQKQGFFTNLFAKWFKHADEKNGRLSFPVQVTGTLKKPVFAMTD
jgi:hypothetical protein